MQLKKLQEEDPDVGPVYKWREGGKWTLGERVCTQHYWHVWESLGVNSGLLFKRFAKTNGTSTCLQLLIPRVRRKEVIIIPNAQHLAIWSSRSNEDKNKCAPVVLLVWTKGRC